MQQEFIVSRGTTTSGQQSFLPEDWKHSHNLYTLFHTSDMLSHRFMAWSVILYWLIVIRDSTQQQGLNSFLFQIETYIPEVLFFDFKNNFTWNKNTVKSSLLTDINFSFSIYTVTQNPMNFKNIPTFPWIINSWIAKFLNISALLQTFSHIFS